MNPEINIEERCHEYQQNINNIVDTVGEVFIGQEEVVQQVVVALIANGHVLIEGVPGLGKTLLVKTIADALAIAQV